MSERFGDLFRLNDTGDVTSTTVHVTPLHLDASGAIAIAGVKAKGWSVAIVPFVAGAAQRHSLAVVARPGADVWVGARSVVEVEPLSDRDHLFVGPREYIVSTDARPRPVASGAGEECPACFEAASVASPLLVCPSCGASACKDCWSRFKDGRCASPSCGHSASLERELYRPEPAEFVSFDADLLERPRGAA